MSGMILWEEGYSPATYYLTESTSDKIGGFLSFPRGWHHGEGRAFENRAIKAAKELVLKALSKNSAIKTDAFPGTNGEIMVCIYIGDETHEFVVERTLAVEYVHETSSSMDEDSITLDLKEALEKISDVVPSTWQFLFTSSPIGTTTNIEDILSASRSSPMTTEAFHQSMRGAFKPVRRIHAPIYGTSIQTYTRNRSYSFDLKQKNYQLESA